MAEKASEVIGLTGQTLEKAIVVAGECSDLELK